MNGNFSRALFCLFLLSLFTPVLGAESDANAVAEKSPAMLLIDVAWQYYRQGHKKQAIEAAGKAVEAYQDAGTNSDMLVSALDTLACMQCGVTNYPVAEELWTRAVTVAELNSGTNNALLGRLLANLGAAYLAQGKYDSAVPTVQRAVDFAHRSGHPNAIYNALNLQSTLRVRQGHYVAAKEPLREMFKLADVYRFSGSVRSNLAYRITKQYCTNAPPARSAFQNAEDEYEYKMARAVVFHKEGCYPEALETAQAALDCAKTAYGTNHPAVGYARALLSSTLAAVNRGKEAEDCELEALRIFEREFGAGEPESIEATDHLAALYERNLEFAKAAGMLAALLDRTIVQRGWASVAVTNLLQRAAFSCLRNDDQSNSVFFAKRLWAMTDAVPDPGLERLAFPLKSAAGLKASSKPAAFTAVPALAPARGEPPLLRMGLLFRHETGIDTRRFLDVLAASNALAAVNNAIESPSGDTVEAAAFFNNIAVLVEHSGDYRTAEENALKALAFMERAVGTNDWRLVPFLNNLAVIYLRTENRERAQPCCERSAAICATSRQVRPLDIAMSQLNLADVRAACRQAKAAKTLYTDALKIAQSTNDCPYGVAANILLALGKANESLKRPSSARAAYEKALSSLDRDLNAEPLERLVVLMHMGDCLARNDDERAERVYQDALEIAHAAAPASLLMYMPLSRLVEFAEKQERYAEAVGICRHLLAILMSPNANAGDIDVSLRKKLVSLEKAQAEKQLYNPMDFSRNKGFQAAMRGNELAQRMWDAPEEMDDAEFGEPGSAVISLCLTARMRAMEGKYDHAATLYRRAVENQEELGTNDVHLAALLREYGGLLCDMGKQQEAEDVLRRAVSICEQPSQTNRWELAQSFKSLGIGLTKSAKYAEAETLLQRAMVIISEDRGKEDKEVANLKATLDVVRMQVGIAGDSREALRSALSRTEQKWGADNHNLVTPLVNLAFAEVQAHNADAAEALLNRAFDIMEKHQAKMAGLHVKKGEQAKAFEHPEIVGVLQSLGSLYAVEKRYDKAESMLRRALNAARQAYGPEHASVADALGSLGTVACFSGKGIEEAESLNQQALAIREKVLGANHPDVASSLIEIGRLEASAGKYDAALQLFERAHAIEYKMLNTVFSFCSEKERLALMDKNMLTRDIFLSLCADKLGDRGAGAGLRYVTKWKGIVLDSLMEDAEAARLSNDPALKELATRLRAAKARLASLALAGTGELTPQQYQANVSELQSQVEELEKNIARQSARFRAARGDRELGLAEVAAALPAGSALVEIADYVNYDFGAKPGENPFTGSRYVAFVLRSGETNPALVNLGSGMEIDAAVLGYQEAMKPMSSSETDKMMIAISGMFKDALLNTFTTNLYGRVWAPIEPVIGGAKRVYLSPDGKLNFISFAGLRDKTGRYVLEDYDISYVSSGRDLARKKLQSDKSRKKDVLFGAPDFGGAAMEPALETIPRSATFRSELAGMGAFGNIVFPPLTNTLVETRSVELLLAGKGRKAETHIGVEASEARVKATEQPGILHFATHGFFLPESDWSEQARGGEPMRQGPGERTADPGKMELENPMHRSGLALAGANLAVKGKAKAGEEDGILTAEEVAGLGLEGTELVVLSACETGLGEAKGGEGVLGLRRAFVRAGAGNLVMALWKIPDFETCVLMQVFYAKYLSGLSASQSLLIAQREILAAERKAGLGHNPYIWAAFVANGVGVQ